MKTIEALREKNGLLVVIVIVDPSFIILEQQKEENILINKNSLKPIVNINDSKKTNNILWLSIYNTHEGIYDVLIQEKYSGI